MESKRANPEEIKARWAYGELRAERWRADYAQYSPDSVRQGVLFDELTAEEKAHLAWMVSQCRKSLAPDIDKFVEYECQLWSKEKLGRTYTLAPMAPDRQSNIPFLSFIACQRFNEESDPRV